MYLKYFLALFYQPIISAQRLNTTAALGDYIIVRPLDLLYLNVLSEGPFAVNELFIKNKAASEQIIDWQFTNEQVINNEEPLNISDTAFIFIETNQSDKGVYSTKATINSSSYTDEARGVIVNG